VSQNETENPHMCFFDGNDNTHERDRIQCAHHSHGYVVSHEESVPISCPKVLAKSPSRVGLDRKNIVGYWQENIVGSWKRMVSRKKGLGEEN
jgi:hypothetical protein